MAEENTQNLVLLTEDLQAIIIGVASSESLITGLANQLRPQLDSIRNLVPNREATRPEEQASNHQGTQATGQGTLQATPTVGTSHAGPGTGQTSRANQGEKDTITTSN